MTHIIDVFSTIDKTPLGILKSVTYIIVALYKETWYSISFISDKNHPFLGWILILQNIEYYN